MTRDELLARINSFYAYKGICHCDTEIPCPCNKEFDPLIEALRAVVELIEEHESDYYLGGLVERIRKAIEKELDAVIK